VFQNITNVSQYCNFLISLEYPMQGSSWDLSLDQTIKNKRG